MTLDPQRGDPRDTNIVDTDGVKYGPVTAPQDVAAFFEKAAASIDRRLCAECGAPLEEARHPAVIICGDCVVKSLGPQPDYWTRRRRRKQTWTLEEIRSELAKELRNIHRMKHHHRRLYGASASAFDKAFFETVGAYIIELGHNNFERSDR